MDEIQNGHHLRESRAAQPAQHEPEAVGAAHDAAAQPGARRATEFLRQRRRARLAVLFDRRRPAAGRGDRAPGHRRDAGAQRDPRCRASRGDLPRPGDHGASAADIAAQLGVSVREHQPDHPHRDAGRSAAERRQVLVVRSADSDPREPDRERAARSGHARESAGSHRRGRRGAAQDRRRLELRPGPSAVRRYNQTPARVPRGGFESRRATRHGDQENLRAADAQASAARRASGRDRQRRIFAGDDHRASRSRWARAC